MATSLRNILILFVLTLYSCQMTTNDNSLTKDKEKFSVDVKAISEFKWTQLADTTKLEVRYLQLNFLNFPDDNYIGKNVLDFTDSILTTSFILTNKQRSDLLDLVSDTSNFSEGDCGTFHLNAGFIVLDKDKVFATIDIGCGYNQWNFNPENPNSKYGSFNEKGFKHMENILDEINLKNNSKK